MRVMRTVQKDRKSRMEQKWNWRADFDRLQRYSDCSFLVQVKQDADANLETTVLKKLQRDREAVKKDLLKFGVHPSVHVAEVFSSLGKARFVHRFGLAPGLALDLRTGWDLNDPAQRAKMWSHLQQRKDNFDCWKLERAWCQDDTHEVGD